MRVAIGIETLLPLGFHLRTRGSSIPGFLHLIGDHEGIMVPAQRLASERNFVLAQGGTIILMRWENSEGDWQCRVTGSMAALSTFLSETAPKPVSFRTERGSKYGPFIAGTN